MFDQTKETRPFLLVDLKAAHTKADSPPTHPETAIAGSLCPLPPKKSSLSRGSVKWLPQKSLPNRVPQKPSGFSSLVRVYLWLAERPEAGACSSKVRELSASSRFKEGEQQL